MAITLSREAYVEFRCFGMADRVSEGRAGCRTELRRRGYDASVAFCSTRLKKGCRTRRRLLVRGGHRRAD